MFAKLEVSGFGTVVAGFSETYCDTLRMGERILKLKFYVYLSVKFLFEVRLIFIPNPSIEEDLLKTDLNCSSVILIDLIF